MNVEHVLQRIAYRGRTDPSIETLRALQNAFLLAVPFENLDIYLGRPFPLDPEHAYGKIVERRRGGFCYECNGLFHDLLIALGFRVTRLSARMVFGEKIGPEYDHLILMVSLGSEFIADVGNGESCRDPLPLQGDAIASAEGRDYRVGAHNGEYALYSRAEGGEWAPRFLFSARPCELREFEAMCHFHQTSPDSFFTKQPLATLATAEGRLSLLGRRLSITRGGERHEQELDSEAELWDCLRTHFGIEVET